MFILTMSILIHLKYHPYYTPVLNRMEAFSLVVAIITMYAGMFYVTGRWYHYMDKNGLKWFFFFTILVPNVTFLGYWVYYMGIEVIKFMIDKGWLKAVQFITCKKLDTKKFVERYSSMHIGERYDQDVEFENEEEKIPK